MSKYNWISLAVVLLIAVASSATTMNFDSYADDAAWVAAGRDGWTFTADSGCDLYLNNIGEPHNNVMQIADNTTGGGITVSNSSFGDVASGGSISFDINEIPAAPNPMYYMIVLLDDDNIIARFQGMVYSSQVNLTTTGGAWAGAQTDSVGDNAWKTFKFELLDGSYRFYIDDTDVYGIALGYTNSLIDGIDEIQFISTAAGYRGNIQLDNFAMVPEPATICLISVVSLAELVCRKRRVL